MNISENNKCPFIFIVLTACNNSKYERTIAYCICVAHTRNEVGLIIDGWFAWKFIVQLAPAYSTTSILFMSSSFNRRSNIGCQCEAQPPSLASQLSHPHCGDDDDGDGDGGGGGGGGLGQPPSLASQLLLPRAAPLRTQRYGDDDGGGDGGDGDDGGQDQPPSPPSQLLLPRGAPLRTHQHYGDDDGGGDDDDGDDGGVRAQPWPQRPGT